MALAAEAELVGQHLPTLLLAEAADGVAEELVALESPISGGRSSLL